MADGSWESYGKNAQHDYDCPDNRWLKEPLKFVFNWEAWSQEQYIITNEIGSKAGIICWPNDWPLQKPERVVLCLKDDGNNDHFYEVIKTSIRLIGDCLQLSAYNLLDANSYCFIYITTQQTNNHILQSLYNQLIEATAIISPSYCAPCPTASMRRPLSIQRIRWPTHLH